MESLVAWVILPALLLGISFGLGALLARVTGMPVPPALAAPLGAALAIVLALAGYVVGLRGLLTPLIIVVLAAAGLALAWRARRGLPRPGLAAAVWTAAYGLYMAPVVLSGHWTWPGYNFVNDTAVQMLLADWLPEQGRTLPPATFVTTTDDVLHTFLVGGYPLGSHALLAGLHQLVPIRLEALYQPYIATFAGLGALAFMVLVRRLIGARWAAFAGFAAVANNLLYQYALQGNMKEIVTAAMLATAAAVGGWTISLLRDADPAGRTRLLVLSAALLAVPASAVVNALGTAGAPYAGLLVVIWLVLVLVHRLVPGPAAFARTLGAGAAVLLAGTVTTLTTLITWGKTTSATFAAPAMANDLGHLARPLELRQTAGIWFIGDYRFPPVGLNATMTTVGVGIVVALLLVAIAYLVLRRNGQVLLFCLPVVVIMALVTPRVSPYADAKTLMLMAPAITLLAALGAAAIGRWTAPAGVGLGAVLLVGVLLSDALAYHDVKLAPTDRMGALRDLNERFAGEGPILFNEPEEFAKTFLEDTTLNSSTEAITPKQVQLRIPQGFGNLYFDLDEQTLEYIQQFPIVAMRRSPVASRPPANYERVYENEYYEAWRRTPRPLAVEHLPLQAVHRVSHEPACDEVIAMADRAREGREILIAAPAPTVVQLNTAEAARSPGWVTHPYRLNMVLTGTPGEAGETVRVPETGTYRAWVAGSFGRPVTAYLDEEPIGSAGGVNNVGQWHELGTVQVERGRHFLQMKRPGGSFAPGDGYAGELGPLALERIEGDRLVRVAPDDAERELCGREWDWIERARP